MLSEKEFDNWLVALRSGKYKQGHGLLRNANNEYCCLGVLADTLDMPCKLTKDHLDRKCYEYNGTDMFLLNKFMSKDMLQVFLAQKNDEGETFEQIANYIEKEKTRWVRSK